MTSATHLFTGKGLQVRKLVLRAAGETTLNRAAETCARLCAEEPA
ncbi:hypothetical protein [Halochromatium sp.]